MIESGYTPDIYTGNGVATSFAYNNKITDKAQLKVSLFTIATEVSEVLVVDTDYTVTGVGEDDGGDVVYNPSGVPMPATKKLIIERVTPPLQSTNYREQGPYSAAVVESSLDKLTAIAQEHGEMLERAALASVESGESGSDIIAAITAAKLAAQAAQAAAETAETNAETAETNAETAETNAETAETNAEAAQAAAEAAQAAAEAAQAAAEAAQTAAQTAETNAETAETNAETAETNAETAQAAAELARDQAVTAKNAAETAEANAETAQANAETAEANAALSAAKMQGTSATSLLIAVASKAFTTQADKFFGVGSWLLITSDANPANYMHGQVTAYSGTSLTVNVTNVGGSGTFADWTIRVSGPRGSEGPAVDFGNIDETLAMNGAAINHAKGSDIASATTTNIGAATGNEISVTGTTTITGLGTVQAGTTRKVRFTGILTLTHHATSLILPTGANITTAAGDTAEFVSLGSGNWYCFSYNRKDGTALAGGYTPTTANALSGSVIDTQTHERSDVVACATTGTTLDDTVPGISDGVEILTKQITPKHASNTIMAFVAGHGFCDSGANTTVHLHKDGGNAVAAIALNIGNNVGNFKLLHSEAAGGTAAQTWSVRLNPSSGGNTVRINASTSGGTRAFGGVSATKLILLEIKA